MSMSGEKSSDLPSELDIEEIARASLLVVTDEKSTSSVRDENDTSPNYLLMTKDNLFLKERECKKTKEHPTRGFLGFLESKYIGSTCLILMCLW